MLDAIQTPQYTNFDDTDCTYLGTVDAMQGHAFDLYEKDTGIAELTELVAVSELHKANGPLAMATPLCVHYHSDHPLRKAYDLVNK